MRLFLPIIALLSLAGAAAAQPAQPSPRALRLSHEIFEALGGPAQITATASRLMSSALSSLPATSLNGKDPRAEAAAVMSAELTKLGPQIVADSELVYAETFTEAQLQDLLAFYQSPTGRIYIAKTPEVSSRVIARMLPAIKQMQVDIMMRACEAHPCTAAQLDQIDKLKAR